MLRCWWNSLGELLLEFVSSWEQMQIREERSQIIVRSNIYRYYHEHINTDFQKGKYYHFCPIYY